MQATLMIVTRYPDDEPCTWPVAVSAPGNLLGRVGYTDRGTAGGTTSYAGREYRLVQCTHAPQWTYLVPIA